MSKRKKAPAKSRPKRTTTPQPTYLMQNQEEVQALADRVKREKLIARVDAVEPAIVALVAAGNYPKIAAASEGVAPRTWDDWVRRAKDGEERFVAFFEAIGNALAKAEVDLVAKLWTPPLDATGKADSGWIKAVQFILERTRRERWGERVEVRVRIEDAMAEMLDDLEAHMSPGAFGELTRALVEIGGSPSGAIGD